MPGRMWRREIRLVKTSLNSINLKGPQGPLRNVGCVKCGGAPAHILLFVYQHDRDLQQALGFILRTSNSNNRVRLISMSKVLDDLYSDTEVSDSVDGPSAGAVLFWIVHENDFIIIQSSKPLFSKRAQIKLSKQGITEWPSMYEFCSYPFTLSLAHLSLL